MRHCTSAVLFLRSSYLLAKDIHGNGAIHSVCTGNGTAMLLSHILIPLAAWLGLIWGLEQPQSSLLLKWPGGLA